MRRIKGYDGEIYFLSDEVYALSRTIENYKKGTRVRLISEDGRVHCFGRILNGDIEVCRVESPFAEFISVNGNDIQMI